MQKMLADKIQSEIIKIFTFNYEEDFLCNTLRIDNFCRLRQ